MARKSFKENDIFSIKKIVGSTTELSARKFFSFDKFLLKRYGLKTLFFAIQHIENRKGFTGVLFPP